MSTTAKQRAAARKRNSPRSAADVERDIVAAPGKNRPGARPSILAEIDAAPARYKRWGFTPEQRVDIDEVFAHERAGTIVCGCSRLARILKARYDLPWAVGTIRDRLLEIKAAL